MSDGLGSTGMYGGSTFRSSWFAAGTKRPRQRLEHFLKHLRRYDIMRRQYENGVDLEGIVPPLVAVLRKPLMVHTRYGHREIRLTRPQVMREVLRDVGAHDIRVQVRRLPSGLPAYYVCRIREDYWGYGLIVEDLFMSKGYPLDDERFVPLMTLGRETFFLRLSPFRKSLRFRGDVGPRSADEIDADLYDIGRYVLQAAWHEDQRPGILAARHLRLPRFQQAIELMYLCLSGDLCSLRSVISESFIGFFESNYPQPAIAEFLRGIERLDGVTLTAVPRDVLQLFERLSRAFEQYLATTVRWGHTRVEVPLHKLLFANAARFKLVADVVVEDPVVCERGLVLERVADEIIQTILSWSNRA